MKYKDFKMLSNDDMKQIIGGDGGGDGPPPPASGFVSEGIGCYKCCRPNGGLCSECVTSYSTAVCPESGNTLTSCPAPCPLN